MLQKKQRVKTIPLPFLTLQNIVRSLTASRVLTFGHGHKNWLRPRFPCLSQRTLVPVPAGVEPHVTIADLPPLWLWGLKNGLGQALSIFSVGAVMVTCRCEQSHELAISECPCSARTLCPPSFTPQPVV